MSFHRSRRESRSVTVRVVVVAAILAILVGAGVAVAVTSMSVDAQHDPTTLRPTPGVEAVEAVDPPVDPQLAAARAEAATTVGRVLPIANNAAGLASAESIAALQRDVAGLDTASRVGSQSDLDAAGFAVQASLAAFGTSAAETCEAQLAAGAGGAPWAAEATDPCAAVRGALDASADVVPALTELEAVGAPSVP
ncbi:hypothetical protein [Agreia sp. Leaf283]|uniref:hypothetical protein n=1 Tax=Agreia sp. Leaf283 TaxID=1736321 RepID=UPI0007256B1A|nr:hypothetical protein [Agreia sp. Leaf283]KQP57827.1 hypothetical protein ASF51_08560 [Agreia sp. Leaf283]